MTRNHLTSNAPRGTRLLIAGGAIGPLLFNIVYLVEGATQPGYDAWRQAVSALSLGDQGWMQVVNFLVCGALVVGFALGLRQSLGGGRGATWGPLLIAAVGAGLLLAGIFATDPAQGYPPGTPPGLEVHSTLHGTLHWILGGFVVFSALPAACLVFARRWASDPAWKGWAAYSVGSGVLMVAFFVAFASASMHDGPAGLFERISIALGMAWMAVLAIRLLWMRPRVPSSPAST